MNPSILDALQTITDCLQWYTEEANANVNDPENEYWIEGQERAIYALVNVRPLLENIKEALANADRYQWIKNQKNLILQTDSQLGDPWTNVETGYRYRPSHRLAVNGTGFSGIEHLDDMIDQAMELYPLKH